MIKICLDTQKFTEKPQTHETALISTRIASNTQSLSFDEFVRSLSNGKTYCPASGFRNQVRKAKNWLGQQVFVADIDNDNIPLAEIQNKCDCFVIQPAVIHETFSSTENCKKWRVIFISDSTVEDPADSLSVLRMIREHFYSDPAIVDLARLLYGTTSDKIRIKSETYFDINNIDLSKYHTQFIVENPESTGRLPDKTKQSIKTEILLKNVKRNIIYSNESRYQRIWHAARKLSQSKLFDEATIISSIKHAADLSKQFNDWDKSVENTVHTAIKWGSAHQWSD